MKQSKTVAYLGPAGTYSQLALLNHFGNDINQCPCLSIDEVFYATEQRLADAGIVPVENSTEGSVNNTQDLLMDSMLCIVGEEVVPIEHNLLVPVDAPTMKIHAIASHGQSLAQCRRWINSHYPKAELIECVSNAEAASRVDAARGVAAIAGSLAARTYQLAIKMKGIQDQMHNSTRFLVLGHIPAMATGSDKTTIIVYTENRPGALFKVLEPFENLRISLTKIDSRPSKKEAWEYVFFIDFEGHQQDINIAELFERLADCTQQVKVLGSYPVYSGQQ
ncbi:MAG: prephenate dehydratase [Gammaproteobacteria bacterium]|nr:prephenate dehydratase [Gammaproteobacteria bacterium]MCY4356895.1 prephenate dehydratase [Gammaproteobacteria bacterium]